MPTNDKTLIFLHISKTAGTSIRYVLRKNYPRREIFHVIDMSAARFYFALLDLRSRHRRFGCVMGHFGYGVHRFVHHDCQYFTMLRDPVKRMISKYHFTLRKKGDPRNWLAQARQIGLEEFIEGRQHINRQTRALAAVDGRFHTGNPGDEIGHADLARAKANLVNGISVVGIAELFDESMVLFQKAFGWADIRYVRSNVSPTKESDIPDQVIERIRKINHFDCELYSYAQELMRRQIESYDGNFQDDLRRFRELNAAYAPLATRR